MPGYLPPDNKHGKIVSHFENNENAQKRFEKTTITTTTTTNTNTKNNINKTPLTYIPPSPPSFPPTPKTYVPIPPAPVIPPTQPKPNIRQDITIEKTTPSKTITTEQKVITTPNTPGQTFNTNTRTTTTTTNNFDNNNRFPPANNNQKIVEKTTTKIFNNQPEKKVVEKVTTTFIDRQPPKQPPVTVTPKPNYPSIPIQPTPEKHIVESCTSPLVSSIHNNKNEQFSCGAFNGQANFGTIAGSMSLLKQLPVFPHVAGYPASYAPDKVPKGAVIAFMPVVILPEDAYSNCNGDSHDNQQPTYGLGVQPAPIPASFSLNSLFSGNQKDQCMCPCSCTQNIPNRVIAKRNADINDVPAPLKDEDETVAKTNKKTIETVAQETVNLAKTTILQPATVDIPESEALKP